MLAFILRRLAQAFLVMLSVAFIAFMLFQYVGDPVASMLGQDATAQQREALRKDLGLDKPFVVQFAHFAGNALQGDFGSSLRQGRKVSTLIAERLPGIQAARARHIPGVTDGLVIELPESAAVPVVASDPARTAPTEAP